MTKRWLGADFTVDYEFWPKIKLLGWKNMLNESCRELRALSNYHKYILSGWIDWGHKSQITFLIRNFKLENLLTRLTKRGEAWGKRRVLIRGTTFVTTARSFEIVFSSEIRQKQSVLYREFRTSKPKECNSKVVGKGLIWILTKGISIWRTEREEI